MHLTIRTTPDGLHVDIPDDEIKVLLEEVLNHPQLQKNVAAKPAVVEKQKDKTVLTAKEAAELLNINTNTLYVWALQKRIPSVKIGRTRRFIKKELLEWFEKQRV